jgi:hypothetical protein
MSVFSLSGRSVWFEGGEEEPDLSLDWGALITRRVRMNANILQNIANKPISTRLASRDN